MRTFAQCLVGALAVFGAMFVVVTLNLPLLVSAGALVATLGLSLYAFGGEEYLK